MSDPQAAIAERLRLNLQMAGVAAPAATIQAIVEQGFLQIPLRFETLLQQEPLDLAPDYLAAWGEAAPPTPASVPAEGATADLRPAPDILAAAQAIRQGALSPVELTEQALARLEQRDATLNAFQLVLAERALSAARHAADELRQGHDRGPLHGIPVAIKDLLHLAGTTTTAGSTIRARQLVGEDSAAVERLEAAGAIIIGKTRMSEFAYAPSSINPHYGPTRNPRSLERDTGGSSSGSAAAVADGIVFAALGSDTGGSIRIPANHCGLVGFKPTFGRISLYGAVNLAWSLDHLGPLTRSVADAALVTAALSGPDSRDVRTRPAAPLAIADLLGREPAVRGLRIGVLRDDGGGAALAPPDVLAAWRTGLQALAKAGAELVEVDVPELRTMWVVGSALLAQEALSYHLPALRSHLDDFGEFMRLRIVAAFAYAPGSLVRAQQARARLRQQANRLFEQVDLLSTPTMPAGAPPLGGLSPTFFTMPFNLLGWPALSVPGGQPDEGLPLGSHWPASRGTRRLCCGRGWWLRLQPAHSQWGDRMKR
mgnify:CR=1 FL=1